MQYREIIAVCSEIHIKHINTLCGQNVEFVNVKLVPHSDHCNYRPSPYRTVNTLRLSYKTSQLMQYREIIAICSEIHTKHVNTLCGQNVEFVNVKPGGTYSDHCNQRFSPYCTVNMLHLGYTTIQLMLCREIIAVCSQIHTKHINTLCGQNVEFVNVKPGGTYSDHCNQRFSPYCTVNTLHLGYKTSQLMLYREIITVCSQIHTKHINTLCGQNVEFVNVKPGGTYSDHWALEGYLAHE